MRIKPLGKVVILVIVLGLGVGAYRLWARGGGGFLESIAPSAKEGGSLVPGKINLPESSSTGAPLASGSVTLPGTGAGCADKPEVRMLGYAWNAQMGLLLANGGAQATNGSLMCKHGVNLKWSRQDDNGKMQEALVAFATELKNGNRNPSKGAHFV